MDFIIVTGLSGAGKSRAVDALEDIGFYCVDNIPPKLIPVFYTLCEQAKPEMKQVAIVTDTRGVRSNSLSGQSHGDRAKQDGSRCFSGSGLHSFIS